jgi:hypothetical protein
MSKKTTKTAPSGPAAATAEKPVSSAIVTPEIDGDEGEAPQGYTNSVLGQFLDPSGPTAKAKEPVAETVEETPADDPDATPETPEEPVEETPAETPDESKEAGDVAEEQPPEQSEAEVPADDGLPPAVRATLAELRADRRELNAKLESMQQELRAARETPAPAQAQSVNARVESLQTPEQIEAERSQVKKALREVEDLSRIVRRDPERAAKLMKQAGLAVVDEDTAESLEDKLDGLRSNLRDSIEEHLPQREKFVQQRQANHAAALKEYPWLAKGESREFQLAMNVYQQNKSVFDSMPNRSEAIGLIVDGMLAREARSKAVKAPPKPIAKAPSVPAAKTAMPGRIQGASKDAVEGKLMKRGDVAGFLQSRLG